MIGAIEKNSGESEVGSERGCNLNGVVRIDLGGVLNISRGGVSPTIQVQGNITYWAEERTQEQSTPERLLGQHRVWRGVTKYRVREAREPLGQGQMM